MSLIIDGSNGLTFNNATTQASAGSVLQVVTAATSTAITTTSTTFVTTGFSASITPKFSTSKIIIFADFGDVGIQSSSNSQNGLGVAVYRNGSQVGANLASQWNYSYATGYWLGSGNICYQDSPATTSSTTYTFYYKVAGPNVTGYLFRDNTQGTIIIMEIAA